MNNLKQLITRNTTQKEIAEKLNLSPQTLSNYINGKTDPPIDTLNKMAEYFNVSIDYICDRQDSNRISYIPEDRQKIINYLLNAPYSVINQIEIFLKGYNSGKSEKQEINFYNPGEEV